jgi:16S rRNA (cytosine967-C5)-methyltransferase
LEAARAICIHGQNAPELTIRVTGPDSPAMESELAEQGIRLQSGTLLTAARRVLSGDIAATAAFRAGQIRIQDEGSQLVAELAGNGKDILDCCAAPGGKTLILAERNPQAEIIACELNPARFAALSQRIADAQLQAPAIVARIRVVQADATELSDDTAYDLVLADVPCSGTGTLGRNPEIRHRLQPADLARHHQRQSSILRGALRATGSRGRIVYSTCSLEPEENEAVIAEVLTQSPDWQQISLIHRIRELRAEGRLTDSGAESLESCVSPDGSLTLLPGKLGPDYPTDGFFMAMLQKRD